MALQHEFRLQLSSGSAILMYVVETTANSDRQGGVHVCSNAGRLFVGRAMD
jgi:hypothetical protein